MTSSLYAARRFASQRRRSTGN